jgi:tRNA pseudouridine55 synthase
MTMQALPEPADGLILLDKPAGITSHDCVAAVRRLCPRKFKVGHGGTLDPFCTGLLILLLGKGTRLASLFQGMSKAYEGIIRLGQGTDTFDRDGQVVAEGIPPSLPPERWQALADSFVGPLMQTPPAFSAKRVGHVRAYTLARRGESVPLEPVPVHIYEFAVHPLSETDLRFRLSCSSGTYVRSIAAEFGTQAGCPAHCHQLSRTEVGSFKVQGTNSLDDPFRESGFIPFDRVDLGLPLHRVSHREERLLLVGQKIPAPLNLQGFSGFVKVLGPTEKFIALGRVSERLLQPAVVFP